MGLASGVPKTKILFGGQGLTVEEEEENQASKMESVEQENQSPNIPSQNESQNHDLIEDKVLQQNEKEEIKWDLLE